MSGEWVFRTEIVGPDGVRVTAAVTVPPGHAGKDVADITEFTQMAAARLLVQLTKAGASPHSQMFQDEVPF